MYTFDYMYYSHSDSTKLPLMCLCVVKKLLFSHRDGTCFLTVTLLLLLRARDSAV